MAKSSNMGVAAAVCLGLILAMAMVADVKAACNIAAMQPCLPAAQTGAFPSGGCCSAVSSMGAGAQGPSCLCSLATSSIARDNGVNVDLAMGIPKKCGFAIPRGFKCNSMWSPCHKSHIITFISASPCLSEGPATHRLSSGPVWLALQSVSMHNIPRPQKRILSKCCSYTHLVPFCCVAKEIYVRIMF